MTQAREGSRMRRWARPVVRALLTVSAVFVLLLGWLFAAGFTYNYLRAETRGTMPIERLARQGSALERAVTRARADSLSTGRYTRGTKWYAARTTSTNGDTIHFRIYRAQDARFPGRLVLPEPYVAGGGRYIVSGRRFEQLGIGIR
ncbi:MAG TPA: hypothetical protein VFT45_00525 [Longimicrobium sp.]|nr:hypothetical protein [Longimicrobium sp.]